MSRNHPSPYITCTVPEYKSSTFQFFFVLFFVYLFIFCLVCVLEVASCRNSRLLDYWKRQNTFDKKFGIKHNLFFSQGQDEIISMQQFQLQDQTDKTSKQRHAVYFCTVTEQRWAQQLESLQTFNVSLYAW